MSKVGSSFGFCPRHALLQATLSRTNTIKNTCESLIRIQFLLVEKTDKKFTIFSSRTLNPRLASKQTQSKTYLKGDLWKYIYILLIYI